MITYIVIGAGLFGAVVAHELREAGKSVTVVEKKDHVGGMVYTEKVEDIHVHKYGAHIFRTDSKDVWDYVNRFADFKPYVHSPVANFEGKMYNLPFNMNTFNKLWGVRTPKEAEKMIQSQIIPCEHPENLEEYVLSVVGTDIYEMFIKGYTEKQWGVPCSELPISVMRRIPIRFTYDNNYYANKPYQGIPIDGYTEFVKSLLSDIYVCNFNGIELLKESSPCCKVIYTGSVDDIFNHDAGYLGYRSLLFSHSYEPTIDNYQGAAVVNFTSSSCLYTRIIEHKHFLGTECEGTVITFEYPIAYEPGEERYYPLNDMENLQLYRSYADRIKDKYPNVILGGRLGSYQYTDMEDTIKNALKLSAHLLQSDV